MRTPEKVDIAPLVAALGGLILLVSLFLDWYQPGLTAWTVFEVLDLVLAALAVATLVAGLAHVVSEADVREGTLLLLGGAAFILVVSQLINHPPAAQGASPKVGAWLALAGSALMVAGGILTATRVSLVLSLSARESADGRAPSERRAPFRRRGPSPAAEAAAVEPEVQDELYPEEERGGPIGADDPEPWTAAPEDETLRFDPDSEDRS